MGQIDLLGFQFPSVHFISSMCSASLIDRAYRITSLAKFDHGALTASAQLSDRNGDAGNPAPLARLGVAS